MFTENRNIEVPNPPTVKVMTRKSAVYIPRLAGVEVEVAGVNGLIEARRALKNYVYQSGGSIVRDGSLPSSGFEILSPPKMGHHAEAWILGLGEKLSEARATVSSSCGLHVHVDARSFMAYDLRRVIFMWRFAEEAVTSVIERSRLEGSMASLNRMSGLANLLRVLYGKQTSREIIYSYMYSRLTGEENKAKYSDYRYHALNLHAWNAKQTFEFRFPHGTVDPKRILSWMSVCTSLIQWAEKTPEKEIPTKPLATRNVKEFLESIGVKSDHVTYLYGR